MFLLAAQTSLCHLVNRFPKQKNKAAVFLAWVCFVQLKSMDMHALAIKNAFVHSHQNRELESQRGDGV